MTALPVTGPSAGGRAGWLERHPLLVSLSAAAGLFGLFQAGFFLLRTREAMPLEAVLGISRACLVIGGVTFLALVPVVLLVRRLHPAWRGGDRSRASWAASVGVAGALSGWMVADAWTSSTTVPESLSPWIEAALALIAGLAASWLQPPGRWRSGAAVATLVLVPLSFIPYPPPPKSDAPPARPAVPPDAKRPDVVLISIDTLRADHLGAYGRAPSITPEMDRIAAEGVVFQRTLASSPWTVPSVASLLTGLPTVRHGAGRPLSSGMTFRRSPLDASFTTIAERLATAGYRTRAVVANAFLSPEAGMAQGFDEFSNPSLGAMGAGMMRDVPLGRLIVSLVPPRTWGDYRAEGLTDIALRWLGEEDARPLLLWVHYMDPHTPYQSDPALLDPAVLSAMVRQAQPEVLADGTVVGEVFVATDLVRSGALWLGPEDRRRLQQYYQREVAYTDRHIGRLFEALRKRSARRPVVAAVTADHGEEFWDHGHFEHGHDYYREVTWVPLLFWGPGVVPAGRAVEALSGLVDVGTTLLDLAGLPVPPPPSPDEGRSLTALFTAPDATATPPRFSGGNLYGLPAVLVEEGPWRFVLRANGAQELYDAKNDPQERHNLAYERPDVSARYRKALEPQLAALLHTGKAGKATEISAEQREALRALGYVR